MIKGIGVDLIELERMEKASAKRKRFVERILTERERDRYKQLTKRNRKLEFLAGRFAAKEAFAKAVGTGIGRLSFQHIEILPDKNSKPTMTAIGFDTQKIYISISHSKAYAIAQVIITE